ncbi:hypothetical protein [Algoriphagus terrigena]|uniref:hypothetical protein n=1 Tax=Algoriphagus terrigena TaxID=344884 RepID=UPI0004001436|nr:hypothetical protein [Algoriphagus terrigena]
MIKRIFKVVFAIVFVGLVLLLGYLFTGPLYNKWVVYPRMDEARQTIWDSYRKPFEVIPLAAYSGVTHAHSYWSHDSRGSLKEILDGAKQAELDFIFFADHARDKLDTFPRSFHGVFEGVLFEAGTETSGNYGGGMMLTPLREGILDLSVPEDSLIHRVVSQGGLVTYVHSEKDHDWDNPDYQAMEIYNIHTDLLDEEGGLMPFLLNHLVNGEKYRHWAYRELYDKQTAILANWDRINQTRKVTGVGSVDAHNNQNIRARYLEDGQVEWVGNNAKTLSIREPGLLEKILLHEPNENGWAFKWELDTYFHSFNFVNNHVFSSGFSSEKIKEGIEKGNALVAFEGLAKADGFQYFALNTEKELAGILGDSVSVQDVHQLKVLSPFPARFRLIRDGELLLETKENSYEFEFSPENQIGNYRIEADLWLADHWVNWIFTNPISLY